MIDITDKEHIIFDFDKTLFWLDLDWEHYFDDIMYDMKKLDSGLFDKYEQGVISWSDMQNRYVAQFGPMILKKVKHNSDVAERKLFRRAVPNEELVTLVRFLDRSIALSIWSSNNKEIIKDILYEYDLLERFQTIVSRDEVEMLKPYPEGFLKIHDGQMSKSKYLMIGNSEADSLAAKAAGIDFHLITMTLPDHPEA